MTATLIICAPLGLACLAAVLGLCVWAIATQRPEDGTPPPSLVPTAPAPAPAGVVTTPALAPAASPPAAHIAKKPGTPRSAARGRRAVRLLRRPGHPHPVAARPEARRR
jgi:hypothetical protein